LLGKLTFVSLVIFASFFSYELLYFLATS
jgi:hypothetical protein